MGKKIKSAAWYIADAKCLLEDEGYAVIPRVNLIEVHSVHSIALGLIGTMNEETLSIAAERAASRLGPEARRAGLVQCSGPEEDVRGGYMNYQQTIICVRPPLIPSPTVNLTTEKEPHHADQNQAEA